MSLDLSDLNSVQQFASLVHADEAIDIDYLILNAGIMPNTDQQSKDGLNICFQVNYLSHFYLTNLLLDRVKQTALKRWKLCANRYGAPVRIIAVSSGAHSTADIPMNGADFDTLAKTKCSYGESKLLQIVHMKTLQRELHAYDQQIQCLSCTPGMTRTDIFGKYAMHSSIIVYPVFAMLYPIYRFVSRSADIGAQTVLHACTNDSTVNGAYYSNCRLKASKGKNECSNDCALWEYVWQRSNELIQSFSR